MFESNFSVKEAIEYFEYYKLVSYMRDLICDVISNCAWSFDMGKINANDKISVENRKTER